MRRAWMLLVLAAVVGFLFPKAVLATPITSSGDLALSGAAVIDFESETMSTYTSLAIGGVSFTADVNLS